MEVKVIASPHLSCLVCSPSATNLAFDPSWRTICRNKASQQLQWLSPSDYWPEYSAFQPFVFDLVLHVFAYLPRFHRDLTDFQSCKWRTSQNWQKWLRLSILRPYLQPRFFMSFNFYILLSDLRSYQKPPQGAVTNFTYHKKRASVWPYLWPTSMAHVARSLFEKLYQELSPWTASPYKRSKPLGRLGSPQWLVSHKQ